MKIKDILKETSPHISFEVFPPKTDAGVESVLAATDKIAALRPSYISVTYGAGGGTSKNTVNIASHIKDDLGVTSLAHLTCVSSTREHVHEVIRQLKEKNIENILALRGDIPKASEFPLPNQYRYASELIREIRQSSRTPVIVLSVRAELSDKVELLGLGADDYLTKPYQLEELWARILVQLRHASALPAETTLRYRDWVLNLEEMTLTAAGQSVSLTAHEFKIVELLAGRPKRVFTKQQIYEAVWREEYAVEDKTITVHISNIRAKLRPSGTDSYIQTVWGIGFKLAE